MTNEQYSNVMNKLTALFCYSIVWIFQISKRRYQTLISLKKGKKFCFIKFQRTKRNRYTPMKNLIHNITNTQSCKTFNSFRILQIDRIKRRKPFFRAERVKQRNLCWSFNRIALSSIRLKAGIRVPVVRRSMALAPNYLSFSKLAARCYRKRTAAIYTKLKL